MKKQENLQNNKEQRKDTQRVIRGSENRKVTREG